MMECIKKYSITRIQSQDIIDEDDDVIVEYPLTIYIDEEEFITLLCSPKSLKHLTLGFLNSEGIIDSKDDIEEVTIYEDKGIACVHLKSNNGLLKKPDEKRTITSGCGKGAMFYDVIDSLKVKKIDEIETLRKEEVISLVKEFNKKSDLFISTGGVH
ncbi:MAG: formate dehydrogenase accessory sulfurtransferase FdhD, partial [Bacillota bacterium]|nr:formate dehydrogenase accessory sulfurtransferase FdhD [Bacillota bacterium]